MSWYEILIIAAAALFVVGVVVWQIVRRAKGKGGCDCADCSGCAACGACKSKPEKQK